MVLAGQVNGRVLGQVAALGVAPQDIWGAVFVQDLGHVPDAHRLCLGLLKGNLKVFLPAHQGVVSAAESHEVGIILQDHLDGAELALVGQSRVKVRQLGLFEAVSLRHQAEELLVLGRVALMLFFGEVFLGGTVQSNVFLPRRNVVL